MRKVLKGNWYCSYSGKIIASVVYLADGADAAAWSLIDEAEKEKLEKEWEPVEAEAPEIDREAQLEIENSDLKKQVAALQKRIDELEFESGGSVVKPDVPFDPVPGTDKPLKPKPGGGLSIGG